MYKIYGLTTQKDDVIKYVGQTSKPLNKKLSQHVYSSLKVKDKYTKKENWIRKRMQEGFVIEIVELEKDLTSEEANIMEISWISHFGLENLTNLTVGGDGTKGKVFNYEERIKWYNAIAVYQYSLSGEFMAKYPTITDCATRLNISHSSVYYCVIGKNITSHGFIFVDKEQALHEKLDILNNQGKYELYDLYGNLVDIDKSVSNLNKKYDLTQRCSEFSKRLNNGVVPESLKEKYFIKYPGFNLMIMLTSLKRYKIINIKTKETREFMLVDDIARFLQCSKGLIISCLSKLRKSARGWQIYHYDENTEQYSKLNSRKIVELDDSGNIMKTFNTIKECGEFYNIDKSGITKVCKGIRLHVKHHRFKYIDDIV